MMPHTQGVSPLDRPIAVTFFTNFAASEKREERYTLRSLASRISTVTADQKGKLPWLKLARFGDIRTDKNSLRHDSNVQAVSGIEADYDNEVMSVDEAVARLEQSGIAAMVYTSPSHSNARPRWRILCPLSAEVTIERRAHLVGRLNGLFNGVMAGESFTGSQAYFFGSVNHNPQHRVELIDGTTIDEHDDLDVTWIGKPHTAAAKPGQASSASGPVDMTALLSEIMTGAGYHTATVRIAGVLARQQLPVMIARQRLVEAMEAVPEESRDGRWRARFADIDRTLFDIYGKEAGRLDREVLPEPPPAIDDPGYWESLNQDGGTVVGQSSEQPQYHSEPDENGEFLPIDPKPAKPQAEAEDQVWRAIVPSRLHGIEVPKRRWIIENWLPKRQVTLNYADGGVGKTLLAMQLMAATALNKPWAGLQVEPCVSLGLFSEDDTDELHIRLDGIRRYYKAEFANMDDMCMVDGTGQDNMLVHWDGQKLVATPRFIQLREHALDIGAKLVVIDTAATTFGGNEIDRSQVTQFVGTFLTRLAQDIDGAVLLNAHPSVSGLASGDLRSGSTAWNNSCRSRWAMTRPADDDGKPKLDSMERVLTRRKSNGAAAGEMLNLEWVEGVFRAPMAVSSGASTSRKDACEVAFLLALKDTPRPVSEDIRAGNYAPRLFATTPACRDFPSKELAEAMVNLKKRGLIHVAEYKQNYRVFYQICISEGQE